MDYSPLLSVLFEPWLQLLMTFSIFLWALSYKTFGRGSTLDYMGSKLSGIIYYFHGLFIFIWVQWLHSPYDYADWGFLYVLFPSLLLAYLITKTQDALGVHIF